MNELDLVFCLDATGSMGSYIHAATYSIAAIVNSIAQRTAADIRFGLVAYRDQSPQDTSFVTQVYPFTSDVAIMHGYLAEISAAGGGDGPEAVAAGMDEVLRMDWRENATKQCVLIADAPPHGVEPTVSMVVEAGSFETLYEPSPTPPAIIDSIFQHESTTTELPGVSYDETKKLGEGAFSDVFAGTDFLHGMATLAVAVKVFKDHGINAVLMFLQELMVWSHLSHPNGRQIWLAASVI